MIGNAFTCTGAYAVLIMSGLKRVENRTKVMVEFEADESELGEKEAATKAVSGSCACNLLQCGV